MTYIDERYRILQSTLIKPTFGLCNQQIDDSEKMVLEILFRSLPCNCSMLIGRSR